MFNVHKKPLFQGKGETLKEAIRCGEHSLIEDHYIVYYTMYKNIIYHDGRKVIGVVDNAVIIEDRNKSRIYVIYCETPEKAEETAKLVSELIQLDIPIDKLIDKIAEMEGMIIENISRTFFIFRERNPH